MARLITQAQFARRSGYSPARITQLVKEGVIPLTKGKIDPAQAEAAIAANIDRSRQLRSQATKGRSHEAKSQAPKSAQMELPMDGGNGKGYAGPSLTQTRRDHELLKMELTEAQIKVKLGEFVPRGEAMQWVGAITSAAKLGFMNLPRRLAGTLTTLTDEKEIEIYLRSEIQKIFRDILEAPLDAKHKRSAKKSSRRSVESRLETSRRDLNPAMG